MKNSDLCSEKKLNPLVKYVLILIPHTKGPNTLPILLSESQVSGQLGKPHWQSLACQVKCDNNNPQLPGTSHDPILTPNCHDTPPGTGQHDPDGSDWDQDPGSSLGPGHTSEFEANNTDSGASPPTTHLKVIINTNAGKPLEGHQETLWERFARQAGEGGYAPFESKEEWELSHWLSTEGLSQGAIDHFWKLKWVSHNFLFTH